MGGEGEKKEYWREFDGSTNLQDRVTATAPARSLQDTLRLINTTDLELSSRRSFQFCRQGRDDCAELCATCSIRIDCDEAEAKRGGCEVGRVTEKVEQAEECALELHNIRNKYVDLE